MVEFIDSIKQVKANVKPYKEWQKKQEELELLRLEYAKQNPLQPNQAQMADSYGRTIIESVNIMDEYSQKKAEHVEEALNQVGSIVPYAGAAVGMIPIGLYKLFSKNTNSAMTKKLIALPIAGFIISTVGFVIAASTMQKSASRIARFQSRETELKDPRNFVVYTPEQIKAAEEIAKTTEDVKNDKKEPSKLNPATQIKEIYGTIKSLIKDKKAYGQWLEQSKIQEAEREKLFNIEPSQEQLNTAKSFQDVLFRTIKKIDIASQDFSENIETISESFTLGAPVIGGIFGGLVSGVIYLLQKAKVAPIDSKMLNTIKKLSAPVAAALLPLAGIFYFVQLQIEASRVGRFKAKQELMKNPYNFIYIKDEDLSTIQQPKILPKEDKGIIKTFINEMKELLEIRKDFKDYKNYVKTEKKDEEKFKLALNQVKIDQNQMNDATLLQDKAFRVFEKMDEMSQRYTEDVEAATGLGVLAAMPVLMGATTTTGFAVMKKFPKQTFPAMILMNAGNIIGILGMSMLATKIQKQASKIGTMKAIEDIKDPKHFVDYTSEQIELSKSFKGREPINQTQNDQVELEQTQVKKVELEQPQIDKVELERPQFDKAELEQHQVEKAKLEQPQVDIQRNQTQAILQSSEMNNWISMINSKKA